MNTFDLSVRDKALALVAGIGLPVACFVVYFLMHRPAGVELLSAALAAYSAICALRLVFGTPQVAQQPAIRFGIYTGVVLALQYAISNALGLGVGTPPLKQLPLGLLLIASGCAAPWLVHRWLRRRWPIHTLAGGVRYWLSVFGLTALLVPVLILLVGALVGLCHEGFHTGRLSWHDVSRFLMVVPVIALCLCCIVLLAFAPFWALGVYALLSVRLWRSPARDVSSLAAGTAGVGAWAGAYAFAWRAAIVQTSQIHHALNPSCFIVTAAARGHRRFVGSWPVSRDGQLVGYANRQLTTFRCLELAMQGVSPAFHRYFRRCYNRVGYPLSRFITHPLASDIVYVLLKPPEWGARLALRLLGPNLDHVARLPQGSCERSQRP